MKKIKLIALALVACSLGLASCGEEEIGSQDNQQQQQADEVVSVVVSSDSTTVTMNKTLQLTATVETKGNASKNVTWSASPNSVATVSESGLVTPVSTGEVVITATSTVDSSKKGSITLNVVAQPKVVSVAISGAHEVMPGEKLQLTANVEVEGSASKEVTWISLNESVATVSESGLVTTLAAGTAAIKAVSKFDDSKFDQVNFAIKAPAVLSFADTMPTLVEPGVPVDFSQFVSVTGDSTFSIAPSEGYKTMVSIEGKTVTFLTEGTVKLTFSAYGTSEEKTFTCIIYDRVILSTVFNGVITDYTTGFIDGTSIVDAESHSSKFTLADGFGNDGEPGGFMAFDGGRLFAYTIVTEGEGDQAHDVILLDESYPYDPFIFEAYNAPLNIDFANAPYIEYEYDYGGEEPAIFPGLVVTGQEAIDICGAAFWVQDGKFSFTDGSKGTLSHIVFEPVQLDENVYGAVGSVFVKIGQEIAYIEDVFLFPGIIDSRWELANEFVNNPDNAPEGFDLIKDVGIDAAFLTKDGNSVGKITTDFSWCAVDSKTGQILGDIEEQDVTDTIFDGAKVTTEYKLLSDNLLAFVDDQNAPQMGTIAQRLEGEAGSEENVVYYYDGYSKWQTDDFNSVWDDKEHNLDYIFNPELWTSEYVNNYEVDPDTGICYITFASTKTGAIVEDLIRSTVNGGPVIAGAEFYEERYGENLWDFWYLDCMYIPADTENGARLVFTAEFIWDDYAEGVLSAYVVQIIVEANETYGEDAGTIYSAIFPEE